MSETHRFPALHNAMWPGLVGKGPGSEPLIDLDTMLALTASAEAEGQRFDGVDQICRGGLHSWRHNVEPLELVNRPKTLGFQADMAHTMFFTMGYNSPEDRLLPENFDWSDRHEPAAAYRKVASALRPWTVDFHVAQNDGTVKGEGSHEKTCRHCLPFDPNGKLDVVRDAVLGCAATTAIGRARSRIFAGTAACSQTR